MFGIRAVAALMVLLTTAPPAWTDKKPKGYRQILPRGRLASVDQPRYVAASEAKLSETTWVLGVVIEGQARAYSLNLLNAHEVVNDAIGGTSFAAVW
jgi:hypothetical protein